MRNPKSFFPDQRSTLLLVELVFNEVSRMDTQQIHEAAKFTR